MRMPLRLCAALLALIAAAVAAEAQTTNYGSITGRVMNEGGPVPFASVIISPVGGRGPGPGPGAGPGPGGISRNATADAEGNFRVDGLPPILWRISAVAPGYVPGYVPDASPEEGANQIYHRVGDNVTIQVVKGGVIAGRVLNAAGEPLIAVRVSAQIVRDAQGQNASNPAGRVAGIGDFQTDDRGVYRIYELQAGTYVVAASPASGFGNPGFAPGGRRNPYDGDAPVYYPSNTRDAAVEVVVSNGGETHGIDIRYRSEKGHAVSGKVAGAAGSDGDGGFISVTLAHAATGTVFNSAFAGPRGRGEAGNHAFSIYGVPDGEYEIAAQRNAPGGDLAVSSPRRVAVIGRDVTGIELTLKPLASVSGRLQLEAAGNCVSKRQASFQEQLFALRADEAGASDQRSSRDPLRSSVPDRSGDLAFRGLSAGRYRVAPRMLDENWFIRSITVPVAAPVSAAKPPAKASPPAAKPTLADVGRNGLNLKSGERLTGLIVNVSDGAAAIKGKVKAAEGAPSPSPLRIHLIPAEREMADDVLRYAETGTGSEGAFSLTNLAPGRYWLLALPAVKAEKSWPEAFDAATRARLRREAEVTTVVIELQPCQRMENYELRLKKISE